MVSANWVTTKEGTRDLLRNVGIDLLRGVAAFGIVGCHLCVEPRTDGGHLVTALCDFNVGVFAAVAGFLMCGRRGDEGWLEYVGKRARRLLPTYFFWSAIFVLATAAFDLLYDGGCLNPRYETAVFWRAVVFWGGSSAQLWFLICLFYAQVALVGVFKACASRWFGVMWIALGGMMASVCAVNLGWFYRYPFRLAAFLMTGYGIGCCLQGRLLEVCRKYNRIVWCCAAVALLLHVVTGAVVPAFVKDWLAVGPVLLAFVGWEPQRERVVKVATVLGATSLGVYLGHPLVTRGLWAVIARMVQPPFSAWDVLGEWVLAWAFSLVVVAGARQVPGVRRLM